MANNCENVLILEHKDPRQIKRVKEAILQKKFFEEFLPCPSELYNDRKDDSDRLHHVEMFEKYGYYGWRDWCEANWGTKWDAYELQIIDESDNLLDLFFNTAWRPPIEFYNHLLELGFELDAKYNELGHGFCGTYIDGTEQYFEYSKDNLDSIPEELDEQFAISSTLLDDEDDDEGNIEEIVNDGLNSVYDDLRQYGDREDFVELVTEAARRYAMECVIKVE